MKLHRWDDIKSKRFSPKELREIDREVDEELLKLSLAELRKGLGVTQEELAEAIDTSQAELSKMERRSDRRMSTLKNYIEGLGGKVELIAVVGGQRVRLHV